MIGLESDQSRANIVTISRCLLCVVESRRSPHCPHILLSAP